MLDWTDTHCRHFHRLLSPHARLYTEMVTTGALLHGDVARHLRFDASQHPVALQLGGSDAAELGACARLGQSWGYDEINLNCGCPSPRVQRGAFGACLMQEPALVADAVRAMRDAVSIPVTVKHRIGIDREDSYDFVRDFVGTVAEAGCEVFIVHARNAWLQGLSPRENREIPPLRYDVVKRLKRDFPHLTFVVNGGLRTTADILAQIGDSPGCHAKLDGVMIGREAYHNPVSLVQWDAALFPKSGVVHGSSVTARHACAPSATDVLTVEAQMVAYMEHEAATHGTHWYAIARHMLGLRHGLPGARRWRQVWSDHRLKDLTAREVSHMANLRTPSPAGKPQ